MLAAIALTKTAKTGQTARSWIWIGDAFEPIVTGFKGGSGSAGNGDCGESGCCVGGNSKA